MESIFNFADTLVSKSEAEDHTRRGWSAGYDAEQTAWYAACQNRKFVLACKQADKKETASYREDEVDALARKAEEGRGDRRNVQGELQASDEP